MRHLDIMAAEASSSTAETVMVMEAPNVCFNSNSSANEEERGKKKAEGDVPRRSHLLQPYYWPQISEEELLKISEDSRPLLKPLFEKILCASAEGRIGRLVIPKKLAEAYFPPISQPEGLPLKVHDLEGKEWVFRFRFWPNNYSRLYVIEGITPYIQSMQLQAGDTLIFSRLVPEGKLVVGCRKKSDASPEKTKDGVQGRSQLLRPYRPWMNDEQLQKISEDKVNWFFSLASPVNLTFSSSTSVIEPLFQKMGSELRSTCLKMKKLKLDQETQVL